MSLTHRYTIPGCAALLSLTLLAAPLRSAETPEDAAQAAAEAWLELVDTGQYDTSWKEASAFFRGAVTREQWDQALGATRAPLGSLVSRRVQSRTYTEQVPGAPDGRYVVLQFETVFENKASAVETVTPMVDEDGAWRVSGYFIK